jgi:hypothetical protein
VGAFFTPQRSKLLGVLFFAALPHITSFQKIGFVLNFSVQPATMTSKEEGFRPCL